MPNNKKLPPASPRFCTNRRPFLIIGPLLSKASIQSRSVEDLVDTRLTDGFRVWRLQTIPVWLETLDPMMIGRHFNSQNFAFLSDPSRNLHGLVDQTTKPDLFQIRV